MKKSLLFVAAFAALVSCTKENPIDENPAVDTPAVEYQTITFEAAAPSTEDNDATRTFEPETSAAAYFSGEINWSHGSEYMDSGIAIYPSTVKASSNRHAGDYLQGNSTVITYDLSSEQTAVENSFQNGLAFSYAEIKSEDKADFIDNKAKLAFKNACSLIKITLPADADDITSVKVESADANLAGDYKVTNTSTSRTL